MAKNPLAKLVDPAMFKHVSSDDDKTTLRHKNGHVLTIAHKTLSPSMQAQLKALSGVANEDATSDQKQEAQNPYGKVVKKFAEGTTDAEPPVVMAGQSGGTPPPKEKTSTEKQGEMGQAAGKGATIPSAGEMWDRVKNGWADGGKICMDEGGKVPVPPSDSSSSNQQQQNAKGAKQGFENSGGIPSASTLADRLKNAWADGGEIPEQDIGNVAGITGQTGYPSDTKIQADEGPKAPSDLAAHIGYLVGKHGIPLVSQAMKDALAPERAAVHGMQRLGAGFSQGSDESDKAESPSQSPSIQVQPQASQPEQPTPPQSDAQAPEQQSQPQQPQVPTQGQGLNPLGMATSGVNQAQQGLREAAKAQGQLGQQQGTIQDQALQAAQNIQQTYQQHLSQLENERQAHIADIQAGHIDPDKYWDNHSKIASAIGLILGGFNPTTRPNAAMEMLKYQMDKNIEAQSKNLDSQQNLLKANLEQFHNIHDATAMTQAMQNDAVSHQLLSAASKMQSPIAQAEAKRLGGMLNIDASSKVQEIAQRQMMLNMMGGNQHSSGDPEADFAHRNQMLQFINPALAKEEAERHVPGIGQASIPVPHDVRQRLGAYNDVMRNLNEALNFKRDNPGAPWSIQDRAKAKTLMSDLSNQIRTAEDMGVFKESEAKMMQGMLGGSPADFTAALRTNPKLQEMMKLKMNELANLKSQYGLPVQGPQSAQKTQQPVTGKDGKQYIRQGNYMVPVK